MLITELDDAIFMLSPFSDHPPNSCSEQSGADISTILLSIAAERNEIDSRAARHIKQKMESSKKRLRPYEPPVVTSSSLEGEYQHESVSKEAIESAGMGAVARGNILSGTVVTRAVGFVAREPSKFSIYREMFSTRWLGADVAVQKEVGTVLLNRCCHFCPSEVDEDLIKSTGWSEDAAVLSEIRDEWIQEHNCEAPLSVAEMQEMGVKLDRNSFFEGTFPSAAIYNHSCMPNCVAMFDDATEMMVVRCGHFHKDSFSFVFFLGL